MFSGTRLFWSRAVDVLLLLLLYFCFTQSVFAFDSRTTLASPVVVEEMVQGGDIISYDPETQMYHASQKWSDENVYGIVVTDPVLYMGDSTASGTHPVIRFGETAVNVSDWGGEIKAGDLVTTSHVVGVGQRMPSSESGYIVGLALTDAEYQQRAYEVDGKEVRIGEALVALRIGYVEGVAEEMAVDLEEAAAGLEDEPEEGMSGIQLFRYILGSFVIIAAIVFVLRRFADLFSQSVISVGRNPMAHARIRSIMIWNAMLIVIIGSMGVGIGVALIVL